MKPTLVTLTITQPTKHHLERGTVWFTSSLSNQNLLRTINALIADNASKVIEVGSGIGMKSQDHEKHSRSPTDHILESLNEQGREQKMIALVCLYS
jgi:hypothetical protein